MNLPFDKIFILHLADDAEREKSVKSEMKRCGIANYEFWYSCRTKIHTTNSIYDKFFNSSLEHYNIIKTSWLRGLNSILILEDDIKFSDDLSILENALNNLPKDWNVLHIHNTYGQMPNSCPYMNNNYALSTNLVNEYWVKEYRTFTKYGGLYSAACYALDRNGMEAFIDAFEEEYKAIDLIFKWLSTFTKYYVPRYMLTDYNIMENGITRNI